MNLLRTLLVSLSVTLLAACNTPGQPRFESMTPAELVEYNQSVGLLDQVVCKKEATTASFIRKRRCQTLGELTLSIYGTLDTASPSTVIYIPHN
ncbi:MAG: hypothetical protein MI746_09255 [Pseudomonadales bacterium]|nr:hypothetical protein [Pseudomonadales bacterium]